jgi:hypothetical protein
MCKWRATYCWKAFDDGYNFFLDLNSIGGPHTELCASKVTGVPILGILGFPFGSLGTKCHLGVSLVAKHIVYYKGEGGGFPKVRAMVGFVSPCLPMVRPCTKSAQITN